MGNQRWWIGLTALSVWMLSSVLVSGCSGVDQAPGLEQSVSPPGSLGVDPARGLVAIPDGDPGLPGDAGVSVDDAASDQDAGIGDVVGPVDASAPLDGQSEDVSTADAGSVDAGDDEDAQGEDVIEPPVDCEVDADCPPAGPCEVATCDAGECIVAWEADGAVCDDGDPCTVDDHCEQGSCEASVPYDCNDGDPCTDDSCWAGVGCVQTPVVCNDEDPCTLDACDPSAGCVTKEINCPPSQNPCEDNLCDLFTGTCVTVSVADDAPCDDGDSCTGGDVCSAGTCVGDAICACQSDADCADVTANPCLGVSVCDLESNSCVPDPSTAVVCAKPDNPCLASACDPGTGACVESVLDDGTVCADLGPCEAAATCTAGTCTVKPVTCDDGDICTVDSCDPETGQCLFTASPGVPCDDGDACTTGEQCSDTGCGGGESACECQTDEDCLAAYDVCAGVPSCQNNSCVMDTTKALVCAGQVGPCQEEVCSSDAGGCITVDLPTETACDAGACYQEGACLLGECMAFPVDCGDDDPCTTDTCAPDTGECVNTPETGVECDDGNPCTTGDVCDSGLCIGGAQACECESDADCVQGWDYCLGLPTCEASSNTCQALPDTAPLCDGPLESCLSHACDPTDGACTVVSQPDGTDCDDGEVCTTGDVCGGGVCVSGPSDQCNDGDACTDDACIAGAGCVHDDVDCDDESLCTTDTCTATGGCQYAPVLCAAATSLCHVSSCDPVTGCGEVPVDDGVGCSDSDLCTYDDSCQSGLCVGTEQVCEADGECTLASCVAGDCLSSKKPDGVLCDDDKACTAGDACTNGVCQGSQKVCDDGDVCTQNTCVEGECEHPPLTGPVCDDGDLCTGGDQCEAGECQGGAVSPEVCDDEDPCTSDACADGACVHQPIVGCGPNFEVCVGLAPGSTCDDGDNETTGDMCLLGYCQGFRAFEADVNLWEVGMEFGDTSANHVGYAEGSWYVTATVEAAFGGDWFGGSAIVRIDDPSNVEVAWSTVQGTPFTGLHERVAVDDAGQVWWLQNGAWSTDTKLTEAFDDDGTTQLSAVTSLTVNKDMRVWILGEPQPGQQGAFTRVCDLELQAGSGLKKASCNSLDWPLEYWSRPGGVAAVSTCADCLDALVVTGSNDPTAGGQFYNDTMESSDGTSHWAVGYYDGPGGEQFQEVTDVAGYGDGSFLVVGTGGHMRYRDSAGNWSNELSTIKSGLWNRVLSGAWAGAEAIVVSAYKASGTDALEIWTCPQSASPTDGANWTAHVLSNNPGGDDPRLNDVWGLPDGTIVAVGAARKTETWLPTRRAMMYVRSPAPQ